VQTAPEPADHPYTPREAPDTRRKPALRPLRTWARRWWTASFSSLARGTALHAAPALVPESDHDERVADAHIDNATPAHANAGRGDGTAIDTDNGAEADDRVQSGTPVPFNAFMAGSTYGTLLHDLLEWQANNDWPAAQASPSAPATAQWQSMLARKAARLTLDGAQQALLADWIPHIARTPLPVHQVLTRASSAIVLGAIDPLNKWAEMGFSLHVQPLGSAQLDGLIQQHILVGHTRQALHPRQLDGMLTGFMDLVLTHEGRYYVLDYKSNKLPAYTPEHLQQALLAHRYDVQYALYLLALHRLLKARLPGYDYNQHMGGALYVFLRGIDQPGAGLHADCPPKALIDALDLAFYTPSTATHPQHEAAP
jgi:exodeoxyribonuclease V beta subunit